jgi:hypothetical protein
VRTRGPWSIAGLALGVGLAAGCEDYYELTVGPTFDRPLGLALSEQVYANVDHCETQGFDELVCSPDQFDGLTAEVVAGTAVQIAALDGELADFVVTGVEAGDAVVAIDGDHASREIRIEVRPVAASRLSVARWGGGIALPELDSPITAFTATVLLARQRHISDDGATLLGTSPWQIDPGPTEVAEADATALATGAVPGRAHITTAIGGELTLDIVDGTAIAAFEIALGSPGSVTPLRVPAGARVELFLLPRDAAGHAIAGQGPAPVTTASPAGVVDVAPLDRYGDIRAIEVRGLAPGSTTVEVTWGDVVEQLAVDVP